MSKKKITYADSILELEQIVAKIEGEEVDVDELAENVKKALQIMLNFMKNVKKLHIDYILVNR